MLRGLGELVRNEQKGLSKPDVQTWLSKPDVQTSLSKPDKDVRGLPAFAVVSRNDRKDWAEGASCRSGQGDSCVSAGAVRVCYPKNPDLEGLATLLRTPGHFPFHIIGLKNIVLRHPAWSIGVRFVWHSHCISTQLSSATEQEASRSPTGLTGAQSRQSVLRRYIMTARHTLLEKTCRYAQIIVILDSYPLVLAIGGLIISS